VTRVCDFSPWASKGVEAAKQNLAHR